MSEGAELGQDLGNSTVPGFQTENGRLRQRAARRRGGLICTDRWDSILGKKQNKTYAHECVCV